MKKNILQSMSLLVFVMVIPNIILSSHNWQTAAFNLYVLAAGWVAAYVRYS